ncbi:YbhB/YbcL family Raf kinase inhibitor-like protein [Aquabacterium sp.]|uniref:YbhB/YbcL family Raf kinase inhibitor-like protein n=1 Tax=Aquabacterium sp. TaxID=1872578 RepID=UPI002488C962|nr:YbhB/YbcL family Raf kinase inhibitor-like protein [Aquabacterium sp.]MDI1259355.1 YbhB/YbcL family Raf kinase inhibitor-like protein [Aquabacterium sp.]
MLEKLPGVIGHVLLDQRAGLDKLAFNKVGLRSGMAAITVSSLAFQDHAPLPVLYTADGAGTSPSLQWTGLPAQAQSAVLIVEDADAPTPQPLVHAIVVGLPPGDGALREGALDEDEGHAPEWACGLNSFLQAHWLPPDPPPGHGVHRYAFQLFALSTMPAWSAKPGREEVLEILQTHAVASGCLIGTYERPDGSQKIEQAEPAAVPLGASAV